MINYQLVKTNFANFIQEIQPKQNNTAWIEGAWNNYDVEDMGLQGLSVDNVKKMHEEIIGKYQSRTLKKVWCENENKLFMWMLCQWEAESKKKASEFQQKDWEMLTNCLPRKLTQDVKFQYKMLSKTSLNDNWDQEQLALLNQIISEQKLQNKWNEVSKQLFKLSSQKFFRRPKQCREQWKNHLDPDIEKGDWTQQNDYELLQLVLDIGKKWSSISKCIGKRTQHAVKNRFNSLIKQYTKIFRKNSQAKTIKRKDQQQQLINFIMKNLKQSEQIQQQQQIKPPSIKKKKLPVAKVTKQQSIKKVFQQPKPIFANPAPVPQSAMKQMYMRQDIDNRIGYVYSPLTPYTAYLDKNKSQLGNLLLVSSPRIISPRFKMITQWQDFDNKQYFYEL